MDGEMFKMFMDLAKPNTDREIETCGILAGIEKRNALFITHILIPKQTGSTDRCTMTNEDEIFEYSIDNGLLTFGWLHTHPNHDCFLSSVDVHTHLSYQMLLKEAVAVVVAPKMKVNFGVFALTDPHGMKTIENCDERGFHPHEKNGIYENTKHTEIRWGSPIYRVVDFRSMKD